jgi:hypothetical protein
MLDITDKIALVIVRCVDYASQDKATEVYEEDLPSSGKASVHPQALRVGGGSEDAETMRYRNVLYFSSWIGDLSYHADARWLLSKHWLSLEMRDSIPWLGSKRPSSCSKKRSSFRLCARSSSAVQFLQLYNLPAQRMRYRPKKGLGLEVHSALWTTGYRKDSTGSR